MTLIDFILKSKLSGYARNAESEKIKFDDDSIGFEIISDSYRYIDRYHGLNAFSGTEQVFDSENTLLWTMNYFGKILPNGSNVKEIYSFLRSAMLLISPEYPFRGPSKLEKENYLYENRQFGSLDHFYGIETIYENTEKVYELFYHGGLIK